MIYENCIPCKNRMNEWMNERMNEWMFEWMNEWMFNDTPAQKHIGYWVSEQGKCMKWLL